MSVANGFRRSGMNVIVMPVIVPVAVLVLKRRMNVRVFVPVQKYQHEGDDEQDGGYQL